MFGSSSPFGQSSSSPFGSQSVFGQTNVTNNSLTPQPFGQSSSSISSTPAFGAASSPGFGTSTPAFGSGGKSAFGQNSLGGFGSATQTSPFGSSTQQSQPAFGSNLFGSTAPFGAQSQPSFGGTNTPAFGSSPSPSFGSSGTAFGVGGTPAFGSAGAFGSTNTSVFPAGGAPAFGTTTTSGFGGTSTSPFGAASASAFGQSNSQAFGASGGAPAFGSTTPSFSFNSSPALGQSTPPFGSAPQPFGTQGSSGAQAITPTFGSSGFGQPVQGGSRVTPYRATEDTDGTSNQPQGKLVSISAMQAYKDKNHEELRWEDYQRSDKGGPNSAGQTTSLSSGVPGAASNPFGSAASNPFGSSQTFGQSAGSPFSMSAPPTQTNLFTPTPAPFGGTGLATTTATFGSSPFGSAPTTTPSLFGSNPAQSSSPFGTSTSAFASSPSIFGTASSTATGSSSLFGPSPGQGQSPVGTSAFGSQSSPLFQSSSPSLGIGSGLGQTSSIFPQTGNFSNAFNTTSNSFGTSGFQNSSLTTGGQLGFSQSTPSLSSFQPSLASQTNSGFNLSNAGQTQAGGAPSIFGQNLGQFNQSSAVLQPVAITNPFGTLPATPHISIGNSGTSPSIQYGISSMPVVDKPSPVRVSSLLTPRHLSQRRIRLPARKYHPKNDGSRVAFFNEDDEAPSTPKADALFIPRENPRALTIRPVDHWPKPSKKEASVLVFENGKSSSENQHSVNGSVAEENNSIANGNGFIKHQSNSVKISEKPNGRCDNKTNQQGDSYITRSGNRGDDAAIIYEHGADVEATMPKLRHAEYYTEPQIQELAAKERLKPGYCRHVKDFVVGRQGYGSIKFLGETDVRRLDLESIVQFNDREVIVYIDDTKKPPVGQGLNKPAEVTLLNIRCFDKKTNTQICEGPKFEKYKEMLKKKAEEQGAEFLSYDPAKTEWKFRVYHFSKYALIDDDQWDLD
ncbi:nuclear pore complex protein NUP98A-like isoform X2 [Silene latifolia]|uniref:nuclear pore complex protein NUP98A-like isoform X2 n=1 Tax=Silene latifolia TaxID=37657 RepID=UPI003D77927B